MVIGSQNLYAKMRFRFLFSSDRIRDEIKALKKQYKSDRKVKDEEIAETSKPKEEEHQNELVQQYASEQRKYSNLKKNIPKEAAER